ncbi:MAG TPA: TonB-dependent receptor [Chitinophagaceae bacterium]|nr:TonB-dependent receptor [Chitinophagaceae bacterium]
MRKIASFLVGAVLVAANIQAQQVSGTVKDQQGKGLEKTTISLLNAKDSSTVKLGITADNGHFVITASKSGQYLISATHVGYVQQYSRVFELSGSGEMNLGELSLPKFTGEMKGVTVTAQKPMVEMKADKMILNVEGTINAVGNDALELLRKSPGVMIDKDDNISLAGKNGVAIYIDGKPNPLSGADLANFLKNLQSAQIESIEIITNPSAKYEAAGNAGIINIKLKKNKSFGTNGSVNLNYNQGSYPKYNAGISLNHRNKNINIFGNYNYNNGKNRSLFQLYREQLDTIFDQHSRMMNHNIGNGFKVGADYTMNKKSTIGVLVTGNIGTNEFTNYSRTPITYKPTMVVNRLLVADNKAENKRRNANFNLNYRFADTSGHELNVDADYGLFRIKSDQFQPNYYYDPTGQNEISRTVYNFIQPTDIDIYSLKTDYEQNAGKGRLGFGGKTSLVKTINNFGRYNVYTGGKTLDLGRSNQFEYRENINALYVNYNKQLKGVMFQAGVRMENSNSTGKSYPLNADGTVNFGIVKNFERHYTDLFPSAALTFNKNPMSQWNLTYSRRIDRPAYQDLNPFEFKLDEYTYMKGNTDLRPQYTNSFGLSNTYKYKLTTMLNYSHVSDVFTQIVDTAEKSKSFLTKKNLATQNVVSLSISYPFQYKNFSSFMNLSSNYSHYRADFGGGNRVIDLDVVAWNFFAQNSLKIGKKWTVEVSGWYASPSLWQGTFKSDAMWSVDMGVQKTIFKGFGTFKVAFADVFNSLHFRGVSNFTGQYLVASGSFDAQQVKFSISRRFGNNQVKASRQRKLGTEDENNRTQGSGGIGQQ